MSNKQHVFEQLGRNANGGPLRPPFDEPTTATDVAVAIHAALIEVGLSPAAIRKVVSTLISRIGVDERAAGAPPGREVRGEHHP